MKKKTLRSLDIKPFIGEVEIANGEIVLEVPKLSALRIIELIKFLGTEAARVWDQVREVALDSSYTEQETIMKVIEVIPAEKLATVLSILLDIDEDSAAALELNDVLEIAYVYVQKTNLKNTFFQIQKIYKEVYGKELPDLKTLLAPPEPEPEQPKEEAGKTA